MRITKMVSDFSETPSFTIRNYSTAFFTGKHQFLKAANVLFAKISAGFLQVEISNLQKLESMFQVVHQRTTKRPHK